MGPLCSAAGQLCFGSQGSTRTVCAAPGPSELPVPEETAVVCTDCSEGWLAWKISELPGVDRSQLCSPTDLGSSLNSPTRSVPFSAEEKIMLSRLL